MVGLTQQGDLLKEIATRRIFQTRISMKKSGDSSMPTKTPFHGNTEELRKLIQLMDGPTQLADLLFQKEIATRKIFQTRISMKKSGDSSMPTKTPFHGNTEELKKPIQPMVGLIQLVDLLLIKDKILLNQQLKPMSMILSEIRLNQPHGSETKDLLQQMEELIKDGVMVIHHTTTDLSRSQSQIRPFKRILLTRKLDQMFGLP